MDKDFYQITKRHDGLFNVWKRKLNSRWKLCRVFFNKRDARHYVYQHLHANVH